MTSNERRIKALEEQGFSIKVKQLRLTEETLSLALRNYHERGLVKSLARSRHELIESGLRPAGHGGVTAIILERDGSDPIITEAVCNPRDHYSKSLGLEIALGRAEAALAS